MRMDREEVPDAEAAKGGGKRGVQKLFKAAFKRADASAARVTAWGGGDESESSSSSSAAAATARPPTGRPPTGRRHRWGSHDDDRSSDCCSVELDGSKSWKVLLALRTAKIQYANEAYPWEKKMKELLLPLPGSSSFLSLLLLPKASDDASDGRYNLLDDTLARADTWLTASQVSGVPIVFMNVQTEALLTKISGETASSTTVNMGSLADLANVSLYGFEDYHGVDIGVVRAVRLWYAPVAGETELEIKMQQGDTRLGFAISRTDEGFIFVSSVAEEESSGAASAAARSGLRELFREARAASKLLVISRVGGEKVLPWTASTCGEIKCFDTVSLSQKLSLHRHALRPIRLHFLLWAADAAAAVPPPPSAAAPEEEEEYEEEDEEESGLGLGLGLGLEKDSVGGSSFRFQNISLPNSWV